jgi:hypothetical protein
MTDIKEQYQELTDQITSCLPLKAYPIRDLVNLLKEKGIHITLKSELTITSVKNSGDISGIMCVIEDEEQRLVCGLTHLIFERSCPLFREIEEYQKKRAKRIRKLNRF